MGKSSQPMSIEECASGLDEIERGRRRESEDERLHRLFELAWTWTLSHHPEFATSVGVSDYNDRWTEWSPEAIATRKAATRKLQEALKTVARVELSATERLNYDLFERGLTEELAGHRFPEELLPVDQLDGPQQSVPRVLAMMPTFDEANYADVLARLRGVPTLVEQVTALLEEGLARGITNPQVTVRDVPTHLDNLMPEAPREGALFRPFERFPEGMSEEARQRWVSEAEAVILDRVYPALRAFRAFLAERYLPRARTTIALSDLPDGREWYAHWVRVMTTTDLTPEEIHEIGRGEVERIRGAMEAIVARLDFAGTFREFVLTLRRDPRFFFDRAEDLLTAYRNIAKRADPELVRLFGRLPRLPYGVEPVPAFAERNQPAAYYQPGSLAGGRPAIFYANTYDLASRPKWEMEALTLHEAVPGHHLQIALAQERDDAPEFRKHGGYTAFVEGWGLYAEGLGKEMGFYADPYAEFGRLGYELWRAVRLVVDTGIHALGWTRDQALDFFRERTGQNDHEVMVEVDRYIALPAQALAYKIGELKLQELRNTAREALGARFDLRAFHDALLAEGALPLDLLEARLTGWIEESKAE